MGAPNSWLSIDFLTWLLALAVAVHLFPSVARTSRSLERTTLLVLLLAASLAGGSKPRVVGDGLEYLMMARQLANLEPPALTSADVADADQFARATLGLRNGFDVQHALVGRDGRRDLPHFWLYSLLVAPLVRALGETTIHPVWGFTAVNAMFLAGAFYLVATRSSAAAAALVLLGPLIWWIDKPHTEILTVSCLSVAVAMWRHSPALALMALGFATAQNPALAPALASLAALALVPNPLNRRIWLCVVAAGGIAALHPLYYWWHLGLWSPLAAAVVHHVPGPTALLTPLIDVNLGMVFAAPALAIAAIIGLVALIHCRVSSGWRLAAGLGTIAILFLLLFSQTRNVNHGATFGPSRYSLWLMPLAIPLLASSRSRTPAILASVGLAWALVVAHPRGAEGYLAHNAVATWLIEHRPQLYAPLPEVFVERTRSMDGWRRVPVASDGCKKVLLVGDGNDARWPIPCAPVPVPAGCAGEWVFCYADYAATGYTFAPTPYFPRAGWSIDLAMSWTVAEQPMWVDALKGSFLPPPMKAGISGSLVIGAEEIDSLQTFQDDQRLVAWIVTGTGAGRIRLSLGVAMLVEMYDSAPRPFRRIGEPWRTLGQPWIDLPPGTTLLVVTRA